MTSFFFILVHLLCSTLVLGHISLSSALGLSGLSPSSALVIKLVQNLGLLNILVPFNFPAFICESQHVIIVGVNLTLNILG